MSLAFGGFSSNRRRQNSQGSNGAPGAAATAGEPAEAASRALARARGGATTAKAAAAATTTTPKANQSAAKQQLEADLLRRSDDLTAKMRVWAYQANAQYASEDAPAGELTLTINAITGGPKLGETFWVAAVSGSVEETGTSTPLAQGTADGLAPQGCPSWSDEPVTLTVHDLSTDVLLFLCESEGTAATRACIGRVILPLTELLPGNPFGTATKTKQLQVDVFPPAPQYAASSSVHTSYAAHCPAVASSGMERPAALEPWRALITVSLALNRSPLSAYLWVPPFNGLIEHPGSERHERPSLPPERILLVAERLRVLLATDWTPAALCLARSRPWSMGLALLGMAYWMCYYGSLGMLPAWVGVLYLINSYAFQALGDDDPPLIWESADVNGRAPSDHPSHAAPMASLSAEEKLKRLEDALLPLVSAAETLAGAIERVKGGAFSGDPRAAFLAALPVLLFGGLACAAGYFASAFIIVTGGIRNACFYAVGIWCLINLATYHHREIKEFFGGGRDVDEDVELARQARANPFASPVSGSLAQRHANSPSYTNDVDGGLDDGPWLESERQAYLSGGLGFLWYNVWLRLPDAPTQAHRTIARRAMRTPGESDEGTFCCI